MRRPAPLPLAPAAAAPVVDCGFMDDDFPEINDFGAIDELITQRKVREKWRERESASARLRFFFLSARQDGDSFANTPSLPDTHRPPKPPPAVAAAAPSPPPAAARSLWRRHRAG